MIQRIYIDTSVVGGIYGDEFDIFTKMFFDKAFRGEIKLIISELLENELINAPERVKRFLQNTSSQPVGICEGNKRSHRVGRNVY